MNEMGAIFKGQEVFTVCQVSEMLGRDKNVIKGYFKHHKTVFVEGVDYYKLSKSDVIAIKKSVAGTSTHRYYATCPSNVTAYTRAGIEKAPDTRAIEDVIRFNNEMVDGRSLHDFLCVKTPYHKWLPRMIEAGDFVEGEDYRTKMSVNNPFVDNLMNHDLTMDMAKEICMLQRNEKGKQARLYFLQLEKDWNSPEKVISSSPSPTNPAWPRPPRCSSRA